MGGGSDDWFYFDGAIDDVRIYNRALSAGEVKQLYEMSRVGSGSPDGLFRLYVPEVGVPTVARSGFYHMGQP